MLTSCQPPQAFRSAVTTTTTTAAATTRATRFGIRPSAAAIPSSFVGHLRLLTGTQIRQLSQETRAAIDQAVASAPVVLFMKGTPEMPQCGFSRASIQILGLQGVNPEKFRAFNVLEDDELRQGELEKGGLWEGVCVLMVLDLGIKEYSEWPTIPQLYLDKEFVGGCDILMSMHQDGSLAKLLEEKGVLVPPEEEEAEQPKA